jgi:polysaccharide export outer membrane protein
MRFLIIIIISLFYLQPALAQDVEGSEELTGEYEFGIGDRIRLIIYGEPDLSGEFEVDGAGEVQLPLIGNIKAKNVSARRLESDVEAAYKDGYLVSPRVTIEVLNFRPFFILGEVKRPGSYPYVSGLNVLNAIALSGGYTYRADKDDVVILRGKGKDKREIEAAEDMLIRPGDSIRVDERFF